MRILNPNWWRALGRDRPFFTAFFHIMVPAALQSLVIHSLTFVDTLMVGQLGETEIAAAALGNQMFFLFHLTLFGVGSASAVFTAQFWGKKDIAAIRRTQGLCLTLALMSAALFTSLCLAIPRRILGIFIEDSEVIRLGTSYLRTAAPSYFMTAMTFSFSSILRSIERPRLPLYASILSLGSNITLNYLLIFGVGPFPALGVTGAALGTAISRGVEAGFLLFWVYRPPRTGAEPNPAAARLGELTAYHIPFVKKYLRIAFPVILNEVGWAGGMTLYKIVYARMGTQALAAVNIAETVIFLLFVFFFGSANASAVMIGKTIGEGDEDRSYDYAIRFSALGCLLGVAVGGLMILIAGPVVGLFDVSAAVKDAARWILIISGIITPARVFNLFMVVGILRGGGDTRTSLIIELCGVWLVGVPLVLAGSLWWGLAVPLVYGLSGSEEFFKNIFGLRRLVSRKWINDLTGSPRDGRSLGDGGEGASHWS